MEGIEGESSEWSRFRRPDTARRSGLWAKAGRVVRLGVAKTGGPSNDSTFFRVPFDDRRESCRFLCCELKCQLYSFTQQQFQRRNLGWQAYPWLWQKHTSCTLYDAASASSKQASSPPACQTIFRIDSGACTWASGYSLGSRPPRLPGALMHKGGNVVVVVYVVVTTVVLVAGAKENCPIVAYGSTASVCTEGSRSSGPVPRVADAIS
jgi:hypothetical protein